MPAGLASDEHLLEILIMNIRIWDATGKQLLEDHSTSVPLHLRIAAWIRYEIDKLRRALRNPAVIDFDDVPF